MNQRTAVVTGAGDGIGEAITMRLLADGWNCIGIEMNPRSAAGMAARIPQGSGSMIVGDVTRTETLNQARVAAEQAGSLSAWVNCAGITRNHPLHQMTQEDLRTILAVNLEATYWGCSIAVQSFVEHSLPGSIVNISSIHGRLGYAEHSGYDMSKAGIDGLTRSVAVEYGHLGIRVNAVAPGAIVTRAFEEQTRSSPDGDRIIDQLSNSAPLGRMGRVDEVASVTSFLLSEDSSFITGQSIAVDGGWTVTNTGPTL